MRERQSLNQNVVVVVVVVIVIIFLAIVDVSCYFMNSCGVVMFICVHVCGQQPVTSADRTGEELERYVPFHPCSSAWQGSQCHPVSSSH